jgi:hypothetical protein
MKHFHVMIKVSTVPLSIVCSLATSFSIHCNWLLIFVLALYTFGTFSKSSTRHISNHVLMCLITAPNQTFLMCYQQPLSKIIIMFPGMCSSCNILTISSHRSLQCLQAVLRLSVITAPPFLSITKVTSSQNGIPSSTSG